jgi:uncharacterized protein with FMN-binding domain
LRRVILALVVTAAAMVLLLSYKTAAQKADPPAALASTPTPSSTPSTTSSSSPSSTGSSGSGSTSGTRTVTGESVDTRWGPVQVQVTKANGKITDVQAVVYPDNNPRDQEINAQALPILRQEALAAQSAQIDMVSGATVTSQGYLSSLQSALDKLNGA